MEANDHIVGVGLLCRRDRFEFNTMRCEFGVPSSTRVLQRVPSDSALLAGWWRCREKACRQMLGPFDIEKGNIHELGEVRVCPLCYTTITDQFDIARTRVLYRVQQ